uniref:Aerolysin-like C-terminal domain-containing protein n=1 Tax=Esox lucius TaxID=8010 RepID=A0A3P8ZF54_ESOLU
VFIIIFTFTLHFITWYKFGLLHYSFPLFTEPMSKASLTPRSSGRPSFGNNLHLKWVTWSGSLPTWAVSVFNKRANRTDYICAPSSGRVYEAGFYNPKYGPYCYSPYYPVEARNPKFTVLVNEENLEPLEWMSASKSYTPPNPVQTHASNNVYVGRKEQGIGSAYSKSYFDVAWEGDVSRHTSGYEVLTLNKDRYSQKISNFRYDVDHKATVSEPPVMLGQYVVINQDCQPVQQTVQLQESTERQSFWQTGISNSLAITSSISVGIPLISASTGVGFTAEKTYTNGNSVTEIITHSLTVTAMVPANQSCTIKLAGKRYKFNIPFTAHLAKQYANGKVHTTTVSGTYHGVQVGEIQGLVERCQPIPSPRPCN